jgi:integrase
MSLYKRKDSPNYWIKITSPNGHCIQQSTGTPEKIRARELHDKLKASLWEQERLGIKPTRSWQDAVIRWLSETSDKATHKEDIAKLRWFDKYLGNLNLDQINLDVIDAIKASKLISAKKSTVNRYLALLRSILIRAKDEWEWIDKSPKIKMFEERADRERSLTPSEALRLLSELPAHQREPVLFALATGLRQSNVVELEWSKVDLERCHAWVPSIKSKNGQAIAVPLNSTAMSILERQKGKHPIRVFTYSGKPLANVATRAWRRALVRAEIFDFRWHDLRHTWATWQRQAGTPTHELQRLGGWKSRVMVERYAHLAPEHLASAAGRIDGMLAGYDLATKPK